MEEKLKFLTLIMMAIGALYVFDGISNGALAGDGVTGLAVSEQSNQDVDCIDSDDANPLARGTTYARLFSVNGEEPKSDVCEGDSLIEYYCALNEPQVEFFTCPDGCIDGACVLAEN